MDITEKLGPINVLMIAEQDIMEILTLSFALHAQLVVKFVEQQVQIALNVSQLLECPTICMKVSVL